MWVKTVQEKILNASYEPSQEPKTVVTLGTGKYNNGADFLLHKRKEGSDQ
ncbi:Uncharacterised protein [Bartonella grahamii]|uniref:Uncharacterized protein n=1 Tax=Bartonella grahamii TaxID=33045 RepID=A0A336NCA6_BARGR|nr:hypothetical protein [Bartonella grahamii]SSZ39163.1 Uncharacterised protein [Bartonella grahamii]